MALYTRESRDRVRDAVDFVELVSAAHRAAPGGPGQLRGAVPVPRRAHPVVRDRPGAKVYYCFGCQAKGDVFTFVQETEGVDFKGALELLADRCGMELQREAEDPREAERRRRRERLLELLARTSAYYERCLWESDEARAGAGVPGGPRARRGGPAGVRRRLRPERLGPRAAGLAPRRVLRAGAVRRPAWRSARRRTGASTTASAGGSCSRLRDLRGRVLGFGARALRDGAAATANGGRRST